MSFSFPLCIPALPRATADYTKPHAAFFAIFCGCFCRIHEISSLSVQLTTTFRSQFLPGNFHAESLITCLSAGWQLKIEFTGGPSGSPKQYFSVFFCCSYSSAPSLRLEQIAYLAQVSPFRSRPYLLSFIDQEQLVPFSATRNTSLRLTSASFGLMPSPDTASLASRILTSRPTYAEKLQGDKSLLPHANTLPLAGHANTSFSHSQFQKT